ncbi:adenosine kinase [Sphingomicrobium astaxanthinifaciens]|uniref:adenosine kinase n=1 Tax=Sphingomicrobium astaxanthinifaciens TaxID=1227949 RepID=UPI001FCB4A1C|nr:adenosine kinase [Sphingomicrobium astaxanthinifaciens]MCJ7420481.1 adenosine kinase [Sphingomicrobium astaxanthinifaciens]
MPETRFDIVAMGDAIVDVIAPATPRFLEEHGLPVGSMQLLSPREADDLYARMGVAEEHSGGSAANSMAGVAGLGGKVAFIGQVADDQFGKIFRHDLTAMGVHFDTPAFEATADRPTGRCLILVTPDGQRTMNTAPGASHELVAGAVSQDLVAKSRILYLEGYLFGPDKPRNAMLAARRIAHAAGNETAFTLSESVIISDRRDRFTALIEEGGIDLLFCNDHEARLLTGHEDVLAAEAALAAKVRTLVVTHGAAGASATVGGTRTKVPAAPVAEVVDTTGAGDLFAAGFLAAYVKDRPIERCLETGAVAAAEVIGHYGARPEVDLKELVSL